MTRAGTEKGTGKCSPSNGTAASKELSHTTKAFLTVVYFRTPVLQAPEKPSCSGPEANAAPTQGFACSEEPPGLEQTPTVPAEELVCTTNLGLEGMKGINPAIHASGLCRK